jgi:hypothetical protein
MADQFSECPINIILGQPFVLAKVKCYFYHCVCNQHSSTVQCPPCSESPCSRESICTLNYPSQWDGQDKGDNPMMMSTSWGRLSIVSGVCPCSVCPFSHCVVVPVPCALSVIVWWSLFHMPFQSLCGGPCTVCPFSHCVVVPVPYALSVIVWWPLFHMSCQSLCISSVVHTSKTTPCNGKKSCLLWTQSMQLPFCCLQITLTSLMILRSMLETPLTWQA